MNFIYGLGIGIVILLIVGFLFLYAWNDKIDEDKTKDLK